MAKKGSRVIEIYDTTCRDGTQAEDIAFSMEDKIRITKRLDELGIHYIEAGWPGSNPKDERFFKEIKKYRWDCAIICAFGMTSKSNLPPEQDSNLKALVRCGSRGATLFGKAWDTHVKEVLGSSLEAHLKATHDSLAYLRPRFDKLFFDAEHFFDGFKRNRSYALQTLKAAEEANVDCLVLCDTNGGTIPSELVRIIKAVKKEVVTPLGIHTHNDAELAVANTIAAVEIGINHVQGTINGYGERCGNSNLCSVIPNIRLKLGLSCIPDDRMVGLREVSRFVAELANQFPNMHQPYVGQSAFAHKGGIHVRAVEKSPETYEHIRPESVGNRQRILISDLSGRSNILYKAKEFGINLSSKDPMTLDILRTLKQLESEGFQFEGADASFELLMKRAMGQQRKHFDLIGFRVITEKIREDAESISEATVMVRVGGKIEHTAALGNGPVNALDNAIRKALERFYPELKKMELVDYKVRVISTVRGTGAKVRVLIESGDGKEKWGTVGVSENIIEASWQALTDSINYKLLKSQTG